MPKDAQHTAWLDAAYLTFPATAKPWQGRTKHFADACNAAHLPVTAQGVDGVDSQIVGRHFSECRAKAANIPRAVRMTLEQNDVLQEAYNLEPYPSSGARMLIMQQTGLDYKQVKHWYEQKAKVLRKQSGVSARHTASNRYATQMWREYNKDERGYAEKLRNGSICPVTGNDLTQQGLQNNISAHSTVNNSNAHAVQQNLGYVGNDMTFGIGPQPVQHLQQAGYYPMPSQTSNQMNQHGLSGLHNTQNYMQMQAQNQANNMPPYQINTMPPPQINNTPSIPMNNMPPHHGIYPIADIFGVGPDHPGYDLQQAAYPGSNMPNNRGLNANPAYQNHSHQPLSNHQYGNTSANHQSALPGDSFAAQNFPAPEQPQDQRRDPVNIPRVEYRSTNKLPRQKPESVAPSRKRTLVIDEDDVEDTPRPEKRHRRMAPAQKLPLAPSESEMTNARPFSESNQAISHEELGATPRKRRVASVKNKTAKDGQSAKQSRSRRNMKPLPTVEYQRRHELNFDLGEEHTNGAVDTAVESGYSSLDSFDWSHGSDNLQLANQNGNAGGNAENTSQASNISPIIPAEMIDPSLEDFEALRNEQPISNTASNATGISGNSPPGIAYSNWNAAHMQEADSSTIFARSTGPAAESMHSEDGEFDLDAGDYSVELPAQELSLPENLTLPQPESQYPELPLDHLTNEQELANADNFLLPSQIMTSTHNLRPVDDFNYDEALAEFNFQLNGGRDYILGAENRET
ncbi:hypothetical protein EYC80_006314 [Monilinia laxa]|uniref:Homeobox domain-containing protein n=1 Tax=Monilinia laxa TaxID=61186 RepID=A0A5N6KIE0_MONLA|nr:hypothetical protein EYC80_006314 [Monilinia laxa]